MTYYAVLGTPEHAKLITHDRHAGVQTAMAWLAFSHLPLELQSLAQPTYVAAMALIERIPTDSAELTAALNRLVEAKDWFMRAGIRSDQGQPGPVPRPAAVVEPPADIGACSGCGQEITEHGFHALTGRTTCSPERTTRDLPTFGFRPDRDWPKG